MATSLTRIAVSDAAAAQLDRPSPDQSADDLQVVRIEGRYRAARRCIDAPCLELSPVNGAAHYSLLVSSSNAPDAIWMLQNTEARIDLSELWPQLPYGPLQFVAQARNGESRLIGAGATCSIIRSPDWHAMETTPLDYQATAQAVVDYLVNKIPDSPGHPGDPLGKCTLLCGYVPSKDYDEHVGADQTESSLVGVGSGHHSAAAIQPLDGNQGPRKCQSWANFRDSIISCPECRGAALDSVAWPVWNRIFHQHEGAQKNSDSALLH